MPTQTRPDKVDLNVFGVQLEHGEFTNLVAATFSRLGSSLAPNELVLRPREALAFCDEFRREIGCVDVPDDVILRALMSRLALKDSSRGPESGPQRTPEYIPPVPGAEWKPRRP